MNLSFDVITREGDKHLPLADILRAEVLNNFQSISEQK